MSRAGRSIGFVLADTLHHTLAHNALVNSMAQFEPDDVLVFTNQPQYWRAYRHRLIDPIVGIEDYNRVIIQGLAEHAVADFYLVMQYDGFVLDGRAFREAFLGVDYIGAPWPQYPFHQVGNGGFSLRSRRLIEAAASLASLRTGGEAEDVFICRTIRPLLEQRADIRFAEPSLAASFSFESPGQSRATFGFHGLFNLPLVYRSSPGFLLSNLPTDIVRARQAELMFGCMGFAPDERAAWHAAIEQRIWQSG